MSKPLVPCAYTVVRRVSRSLSRVYDHAVVPAGLNTTQFALLRANNHADGQPLAGITEGLSMDRTSLYRSLTLLKRAGWITVRILSGSLGALLGYRRALPFLLGITSGLLIIMLICATLSSAMSTCLPTVTPYVRVLGLFSE